MPRASASRPIVSRALLMGLSNTPWGFYGALVLLIIPQLLAERHVPEPTIASITAAALIPGFCGFLFAPILDVRFSRRGYAIVFGLLTAMIAYLALRSLDDLPRLCALLVAGYLSAVMNYNALGGWLGAIVEPGEESQLAAGFTIANIGAFGVAAILFVTLLRGWPGRTGEALVALSIVAPVAMLAFIPAATAGRRAARESFATLWRDLALLVRRRAVLRALLLFCLPASAFALTNTLGGLGEDFGASESFVGLVAGVGVTLAGLFGSLAVPRLIERIAPPLLYLAIGGGGALFTLAFLLLPHNPASFAMLLVGENALQAAAFAVEATIIFRMIGDDNPLAATQFGLLQASTIFPIAYMQEVDGQAYGLFGVAGSLGADAVISLGACALLLPLVVYWARPGAMGAERAPVMADRAAL